MEWQPIETAPKGEWQERDGPRGSKIKFHVPTRIIAKMSDGDWTVSYWIEKECRWCMFTKATPPEAWCIPPE